MGTLIQAPGILSAVVAVAAAAWLGLVSAMRKAQMTAGPVAASLSGVKSGCATVRAPWAVLSCQQRIVRWRSSP
jgi:hypothetical protein